MAASTLALPTGLLELTFARTAARLGSHQVRRSGLTKNGPLARRVLRQEGSLTIKPNNVAVGRQSELQRRVQALETRVAEQLDTPRFSEGELMSIYEDLLALPTTEKTEQTSSSHADEDTYILDGLYKRLMGPVESAEAEPGISTLSSTLRSLRTQTSDTFIGTLQMNESQESSIHRRLISRLEEIITRLTTVQSAFNSSDTVPITILSEKEWLSLIRICAQGQDYNAAETSLKLMKRSGMSLPEEAANLILEQYANSGMTNNIEQFMSYLLTESPTPRQRDLHVKAYIKAIPPQSFPMEALSILHKYEVQSLPAPMATYTRLITALFSVNSSVAYAQAWDLFSHMRYVAHPNPDAVLYTSMIRACASPLMSSSEPERALDLWTEMTVDHRLTPTAGTYDAAILACARSGRKAYVNEAFRLAKQMLDSHRDARGRSAFRPSGRTFKALLDGAKRIGDLARSRWILAEMVKGGDKDKNDGFIDADVTEEVMVHVFHAYASYNPPFQRSAVPLVDIKNTELKDPQASHQLEPSSSIPDLLHTSSRPSESQLPMTGDRPSFSHLPPQNHSEVIAEAKALFDRIMADTMPHTSLGLEQNHFSDEKKFSRVQLTPRLLNSYLSVYYAHSTLETSRMLFGDLFRDLGVSRNARSYVEALERCSRAKRGHERRLALSWAEGLWEDWTVLENKLRESSASNAARMIERANTAMIRILTLSSNLGQAFSHVEQFVQRYPPGAIRVSPPKPALRSTRTVLDGQRPLVRMTSSTEIPDDTVPSLLTFSDLEILHHRLVAAKEREKIGYIKYVCKTYEGALRVRRDQTMLSKPSESI